MQTRFRRCLLVVGAVTLGALTPGLVWADTTTQETEITRSGPCMTETTTSTSSSTTEKSSSPQVITVEKPIILQSKEKIIEKQFVSQKSSHKACTSARRKTVAVRPRAARRNLTAMASKSKVLERTVERTTEKPVMIEKPVFVDRPVEKVVEKPVYIDRVIEKPVPVEVEQPVVIEKEKAVPVAPLPTVIEQKDGHHLLDFKMF